MASAARGRAALLLLTHLLLASVGCSLQLSVIAPLRLSWSPVLRLRGGEGSSPVTIRVHTREGIKRVTLANEDVTLADLRRALQKEHRVVLSRQGSFSRGPGGSQPLDESAEATLGSLGISHGTVLHMGLNAASSSTSSSGGSSGGAPTAATRAPARASRRRRATSMADFEAERSQFEIVLETPKPATCAYVAVERRAAKRFSDLLLDIEFEVRRVAYLYGRWEDGPNGKAGVQVDVVYEPPQECDEETMSLEEGAEARTEMARAGEIARGLGLPLVGLAYAHPPRHHLMELDELAFIARERAAAIAAEPASRAADLFVAMRFRPVYEGEEIDADVTAEVSPPTLRLTACFIQLAARLTA